MCRCVSKNSDRHSRSGVYRLLAALSSLTTHSGVGEILAVVILPGKYRIPMQVRWRQEQDAVLMAGFTRAELAFL